MSLASFRDPAVPEVFAALGQLGIAGLADTGVREAVAKLAVKVVRDFDSAPDLDEVKARLVEFDEAFSDPFVQGLLEVTGDADGSEA